MFHSMVGAHEALNVANEVLGNKNDPREVNLGGRRYRHWSFYLLLLGATAGAVTIIVASILTIYTLIAAGVILFVTNAIGAYYVRKFDRFRELEDYVNILNSRIHEMADQVKTLKHVKDELNGTATALDNNVKETEKVWDKGAKDVRKQAEELEKTRVKLVETEKRLRTYQGLYENLSKSVGAFSNNVADFNAGNKVFDAHIEKLTDEVAKHREVVDSLHAADAEIDKDTDIYQRLNEANVAFLNDFQRQLAKIGSFHEDAKTIRADLDKRTQQVQAANMMVTKALERAVNLSKVDAAQNEQFANQIAIEKQLLETIAKLTNR